MLSKILVQVTAEMEESFSILLGELGLSCRWLAIPSASPFLLEEWHNPLRETSHPL